MVKPLTYVTVHDDDGEDHTFSPQDELPDWAVEKISNPNVLPKRDSDPAPAAQPDGATPPAGATPPSAPASAAPSTPAGDSTAKPAAK